MTGEGPGLDLNSTTTSPLNSTQCGNLLATIESMTLHQQAVFMGGFFIFIRELTSQVVALVSTGESTFPVQPSNQTAEGNHSAYYDRKRHRRKDEDEGDDFMSMQLSQSMKQRTYILFSAVQESLDKAAEPGDQSLHTASPSEGPAYCPGKRSRSCDPSSGSHALGLPG